MLTELDDIITVKDWCRALHVSRPTFQQMRERGLVDPPLRTGTSRLLWHKSSLTKFLVPEGPLPTEAPAPLSIEQVQALVRQEIAQVFSTLAKGAPHGPDR